MTRKMPQVREFMTAAPVTVQSDASLVEVQVLMRRHGVRHLPVRKNGSLVGVVSDRNVQAEIGSPYGERYTAEDVMISDPFTVPPHAELDGVVAAMAEEKYGCVLVQDEGGELLGIFTTVDACRALRQVLETYFPG